MLSWLLSPVNTSLRSSCQEKENGEDETGGILDVVNDDGKEGGARED